MENSSPSPSYIEIATRVRETNRVHRGYLVPIEDEAKIAKERPHNVDKWRSHWVYKNMDDRKDLKSAVRYLDDIVLDYDYPGVDSKELVVIGKNYCSKIIDWMADNGYDSSLVSLWLSGSKGFHIHLNNYLFHRIEGSNTIHHVARAIVEHLCQQADIPLPDMSLYTWSSVYRIKNSTHPATGKPKQHVAIFKPPYNPDEHEDSALMMAELALSLKPKTNTIVLHQATPTEDYFAMCGQSLYRMGFARAKHLYGRHDSVFRLAVWMRFNHMPIEMAEKSIISWLDEPGIAYNRENSLQAISDVYTTPYNMGCADRIFSTLCDSRCPLYNNRKLQPINQ